MQDEAEAVDPTHITGASLGGPVHPPGSTPHLLRRDPAWICSLHCSLFRPLLPRNQSCALAALLGLSQGPAASGSSSSV